MGGGELSIGSEYNEDYSVAYVLRVYVSVIYQPLSIGILLGLQLFLLGKLLFILRTLQQIHNRRIPKGGQQILKVSCFQLFTVHLPINDRNSLRRTSRSVQPRPLLPYSRAVEVYQVLKILGYHTLSTGAIHQTLYQLQVRPFQCNWPRVRFGHCQIMDALSICFSSLFRRLKYSKQLIQEYVRDMRRTNIPYVWYARDFEPRIQDSSRLTALLELVPSGCHGHNRRGAFYNLPQDPWLRKLRQPTTQWSTDLISRALQGCVICDEGKKDHVLPTPWRLLGKNMDMG